MKTFELYLQSATQYEHFTDVVSFVGEDSSGSFGIMAGCEHFVTVLEFGLARFVVLDSRGERQAHFLAQPGGVLRMADNRLAFSARRYLRHRDSHRLRSALEHELRNEEQQLATVKQSLRRLEESMLQRLSELSKSGVDYGRQ